MKKNTLTDKAIDKQKKILIIAIFLVITLFIGSSYALLTNFDKTDNVITIKSGNLTMTIAADTVNLNNKLPESNEDGLKGTTTTITLTNTGTMNIEGYDVKLVNETGTSNVSTLDNKYIKYAISLDNITFSDPQILSSNNNIIYTGYNLAVNASKTLYLKVWIDNAAGNNAINKSFYGSIKVDLYQKKDVPASELIKSQIANNTTSTCTNLSIEEDGITYLSGTKDCINFNYVWYSGKLWRITAINSDGTMKMITDDLITSISYGSDVNFYDISLKDDTTYTGSYVYQWLNEDFLDTLYNYKNIIVEDSTWNITTSDSESTKLASTTLINNSTIGKNTPVGLLNNYENYLSYKNVSSSTCYLNIGYDWWLLNPYNDTSIWYNDTNVTGTDLHYYEDAFTTGGIRPSINLKYNISFSDGIGTKDNPYKISGDKEKPTVNTTLLNTRTIGEYVVFDEDGSNSTKEIYRIVGIEDGKVKLNKNDYIKSGTTTLSKKISTSITYGSGDSDDYWDYYLNNTWYNNLASKNMLDKGIYYIKVLTFSNYFDYNYKDALCNEDSTIETTKSCEKTADILNSSYIGLPRYGEMFATQQGNGIPTSAYMWLITPNNSSTSQVFNVRDDGVVFLNDITYTYAARPSIYLKSTVKITGGDGTKSNPFTISV